MAPSPINTCPSLNIPTASVGFNWFWRLMVHAALRSPRLSSIRWRTRTLRATLLQQGAKQFHAIMPDGARIHALHLRSQTPNGLLPVMVAHGIIEAKEFHLNHARRLLQRGHDVILLDLRAHGQSGGRYTTFGILEQQDLRLLLDRAYDLGLINTPVITMGHSLGASSVILHAGGDPRVAGVIALAPYYNLYMAVCSYRRRFFRWISEPGLLAAYDHVFRQLGLNFRDASPALAMINLATPLLLAVGQQDTELTFQQHTQPLAALKTQGICRLVTVPGANHFTLARRPWPELDQSVADFCRQVSQSHL